MCVLRQLAGNRGIGFVSCCQEGSHPIEGCPIWPWPIDIDRLLFRIAPVLIPCLFSDEGESESGKRASTEGGHRWQCCWSSSSSNKSSIYWSNWTCRYLATGEELTLSNWQIWNVCVCVYWYDLCRRALVQRQASTIGNRVPVAAAPTATGRRLLTPTPLMVGWLLSTSFLPTLQFYCFN